MTVFGIDLGTTFSCVAYMGDANRPTVVRNLDDSDTTPSVVYFESSDNVVVGTHAREALTYSAEHVKTRIKRDMGHPVTYEFWGRQYSPEEISAKILRKLADDTAVNTGQDVTDVVITVPAYFGINERAATKKAGELAGLNVIDIVSEPIAAAISYGSLNADANRTLLVFDLGGGTFDTTVITMRDGDITTVCTDGDHELGGADWDDEVSVFLLTEFRRQHADAADPLADEQAVEEVRLAAEGAKRKLSTTTRQNVRLMYDGRVAAVELTREKLEELTHTLLAKAMEITRRTIETAKEKGVERIDEVLLVGGSTKMPAVKERLAEQFGFEPKLFDPDLAVAKGAAIFAFEETYRRMLAEGGQQAERANLMAAQAGLSESQQQAMRKRTIATTVSKSFGVVIYDEHEKQNYVDHLLHANDQLPAERTEDYYTLEDNQTAIRIRVMEQSGAQESREMSNNREIQRGDIAIPPRKPRGWPVEVSFHLDRSNLLTVTVIERETGGRLNLTVQTN